MRRAAPLFVLTLVIFILISRATSVAQNGELVITKLSSEIPDPSSFSNVTNHEGDLIVGNNSKLLIENCFFNMTGKMRISEEAKVIIRNAVFISNWSSSDEPDTISGNEHWRTRHIVVENNGLLEISDCDLILDSRSVRAGYCGFLLFDQAFVNITSTNFIHIWGGGEIIYLYNNSRLIMNRVSLSTYESSTIYSDKQSTILCYDETDLQAQDSIVEGLYFKSDNCTAYLHSLEIESFDVVYDDHSRISVFDSKIGELVSYYNSTSSIWLENCTIGILSIGGESQVWLHNSLIVEDYYLRSGSVFAVWDLPLVGQLSVPYLWAPIIIPIIVAIIVSVVILLFVIKYLQAKSNSMVDPQKSARRELLWNPPNLKINGTMRTHFRKRVRLSKETQLHFANVQLDKAKKQTRSGLITGIFGAIVLAFGIYGSWTSWLFTLVLGIPFFLPIGLIFTFIGLLESCFGIFKSSKLTEQLETMSSSASEKQLKRNE